MNKNTVSLAAAALLISGGVTYAQQQRYDSRDAANPAPQTATPGTTGRDIPVPGNATEVKPAEPPLAGPILPDTKQPTTSEQAPPSTSPNAPLADD
jgi:hypothetical protein